MKHSLVCEAPICMQDTTPGWKGDVIWYPGEKICTSRAYNRVKVVQKRINRLLEKGLIKNPYQGFTYDMLAARRAVRGGISGINPNAYI